jgi:hypothetical protein
MRRLFWIVLITVVILAGAWSGGWFALASWVEARVPQVLDEIADHGVEVECERQGVVGFPFAMQVDCGEARVSESGTGSGAAVGGLTGGVSVFAPMTATVALKSPAVIESPLLPGAVEFTWDEAQLGMGLGMSGPQTVSFEASGLTGELPGGHVTAGTASGAAAPAADGGTEGRFSFTGLVLSNSEATLPALDGAIAGWISAPPRALAAGAGLQAPLSARFDDTVITTGGSRLEVNGNIAVDAEGILDGAITVRLAGTEGFQALIAALPPEHQERGNQAIGGLFLLGSPITMDGQPGSEVIIEIVQGTAKVGPFERVLPRLPL